MAAQAAHWTVAHWSTKPTPAHRIDQCDQWASDRSQAAVPQNLTYILRPTTSPRPPRKLIRSWPSICSPTSPVPPLLRARPKLHETPCRAQLLRRSNHPPLPTTPQIPVPSADTTYAARVVGLRAPSAEPPSRSVAAFPWRKTNSSNCAPTWCAFGIRSRFCHSYRSRCFRPFRVCRASGSSQPWRLRLLLAFDSRRFETSTSFPTRCATACVESVHDFTKHSSLKVASRSSFASTRHLGLSDCCRRNSPSSIARSSSRGGVSLVLVSSRKRSTPKHFGFARAR